MNEGVDHAVISLLSECGDRARAHRGKRDDHF